MSKAEGRTYPLAALFVLIAVVAVLMALVHSAVQQNTLEFGAVVVAAVVSGLFGMGVGTVAGFRHQRRVRGLFMGMFVGGISGAVAGFLLVVPPDFRAVLAGCAILLATGVVFRLASK